MPANPVPQRARRAAADRHRQGDGRAMVPAAQARDTGRDEVQWLTPAEYRQWRDTGLRGYRADGLPDAGFRGRWASRNALFADVMVRIRDPLVIDPARGGASAVVVRRPDGGEAVIRVGQLTPGERARLLVRTPDGLEPAGLWLAEHGMPVSLSGWKGIFRDASSRCARAGVPVACHPHMLRHTFAVVTLEQLQRGRIAALADMTPGQRGQYQRIFGDPLDWVRRRLGHRSAETTLKYLHVLQELEMRTRMKLIPPDWDDTRLLLEAAG